MALDRQGNAIAAGQVFALAGTVRSIDGDSILIVVGDRGEHAFRCKAGHIVPVDATTAGGGGAPTDATYIVQAASGGLSAERVLTDSFWVTFDWATPGVVTAGFGAGVPGALLGLFAPVFSLLGHTHDASEIGSGVVAAARLGTGTPGSGTYLRGDGVWSATSAFAAASHTHAAADVTSGVFATARLGSGTASASNVLRGDGAWTTIPTAAIADDAVTDAKLRNSAALSLIGRSANSSGDPADIVNTTDHQVMRRSGSSIGWGSVNLAQSAAVTGALPIANGGTGATSASAARTALGVAAASHTHEARDVIVNTADWTGFLAGAAGAGSMNVQELFDYIDSNGLTPP